LDGPGAGTELNCLSLNGGFPNGVWCGNIDQYCTSGWCRPDDHDAPTDYVCDDPLAEGDDCDVEDTTLDVCEDGTFCKHPLDDSAGECAPQGLAGEGCDPTNGGQDCLNGFEGTCVFRNDPFVCDSYSLPPETQYCDGE
jgi:hypothetical protein